MFIYLIVLVLWIQTCLQSEKFITIIKKDSVFNFFEHTLKSSNLHIKIKALNLFDDDDRFKVTYVKTIQNIEDHK